MSLVIASDVVSRALSGLATALRVPVSIAALTVLGVLTMEFGRLLIETWRRVRPGNPKLQEVARQAMSGAVPADDIARRAPGPLSERAVLDLAGASHSGAEAIEYALADYELRIQRRLDRTRMLVRAGPALGLMGTLIPLAPGLAALGDGDFATLAGDLRIAFSATVVGILVGMGAFALTLIRTRLYTEDLAALERAVAALDPKLPPHHRVNPAVGDHST